MSTQLERERRSDGVIGIPPADTDPVRDTRMAGLSLDAVLDHAGRVRARRDSFRSVLHRARQRHVVPSGYGDAGNVYTIPATAEPAFPGDEDIERRIRSYVRWNAAMIVHRGADDPASASGATSRPTPNCPAASVPQGRGGMRAAWVKSLRADTEVAMGGGSISSA